MSATAPAPIDALCMACEDETCDFKPMRFQRRALGPLDIEIAMKFCGVCHSDLHTAASHIKGVGRTTEYPCTPGHELAGVCVAVGQHVSKFKVGDHVGVGCLIDSCHTCAACLAGEEQKCPKSVGTYNSVDHSGRAAQLPLGRRTIGGYASKMVVHERFGILIPSEYPLEKAGPVLCSGITMFDPLKKYGATKGTRVGVVGLGGLGVMGIKLAKALGCTVTAISRSPAKQALADHSGATSFVASADAKLMAASASSLDLILNTIPAHHDWAAYQPLLARGGKHVILGANATMGAAMYAPKLRVFSTPSVVHSMIGGVANTQECIDLCAREKIYPETQVVPVQQLNEVYSKLDASNDAGVRYVLDLEGSLNVEAIGTCNAPPPTLGPNTTGLSYGTIIADALRIAAFH